MYVHRSVLATYIPSCDVVAITIMADLADEEGRCRQNTKIFITFVCSADCVINVKVQITVYPQFMYEKFVRKCLSFISPSWLEIPFSGWV